MNKKLKIIIVISNIINVILIASIILILMRNLKESREMTNILNEGYYGEDEYTDYQGTEYYDNNSYETGEKFIMPNLEGVNYQELNEYLNNNNLSVFTEIKYRLDENDGFSSGRLAIPYKILNTIPKPGTEINIYESNELIANTTTIYAIEEIYINSENKSKLDVDNFGKKIKIQIGKDENSIVEGTIGTDFKHSSESYYDLKYSCVDCTKENFWERHKEKRAGYIYKDDIEREDAVSYVKGKVWIDDQFIKEVKFTLIKNKISGNI